MILNDEIISNALSLVEEGISLCFEGSNPKVTELLTLVKKSSQLIDNLKIKILVDQLSKDLNMETTKNLLINYIRKSDKNAMVVINIFKKSLLSESIIAIALMGIILGKLMGKNESPDMFDLIMYKALENATDLDLVIFYEMIKSEKIKNKNEMTNEEILTCEWCVYNRIFKEHVMEWNIREQYTNTEISNKLYEYLQEVPTYILQGHFDEKSTKR